jgi:hypothetical protein
MACHLEGRPAWKAAAGWKPLRLLQRLEAGSLIRCAAGDLAVIVLYADGGRYKIGPGSTATIGARSVTGAKALGSAGAAAASVAQRLGGARNGAVMARPAAALQRLHFQDPAVPPIPNAAPAADWLRQNERSWHMGALPGAHSYRFTLFDPKDYVLFSGPVGQPPAAGSTDIGAATIEVALPDDVVLRPRRPYVWRLHGFAADGKLVPASRWGILTVLTDADAVAVAKSSSALLGADGKLSGDAAQLALMTDMYSSYGLLENALEVLDSEPMNQQPGIEETRLKIVGPAGNYARMLVETARIANQNLDENP